MRPKRMPTKAAAPERRVVLSEEARSEEVRAASAQVLRTWQTDAFQSMSREDLIQPQAILQHGREYGIWETPPSWFIGGNPAIWSIDLRARTIRFLPTHLHALATDTSQVYLAKLLDNAVLSITRYAILCRVGSVGMKRGAWQPLDPATISWNLYNFVTQMAGISVAKAIEGQPEHDSEEEGRCFARLIDSDISEGGLSNRARQCCAAEMLRMRILADRRLWSDAPPTSDTAKKTTKVSGDAPQANPQTKTVPHLPFPDDFVSEMGSKSAWLITHLGPQVIAVLEDFQKIWRDSAADGISGATATMRCAAYLGERNWRDASGNPINALPFRVRLNQIGAKGRAGKRKVTDQFAWPPKTAAQVLGLAKTVQGAHMFVVGLSTGPRRTELLSFDRDCVQRAKDGERYANGRTFKLVQRHDGEERDWVLPDFAVQAIEQQARLVALFEKLSDINEPVDPSSLPTGNHLWGQIAAGGKGDRALPLSGGGLNIAFQHYSRDLDMDPMPGGQSVRSHRFRKTLARLAALAITHAPKVLQDVFGHKSIEMTLYYILSDKDLMAEVETVAKELRVMRAEEVINEMVAAEEAGAAVSKAGGLAFDEAAALGGFGGRAAISTRNAITEHREHLHRTGATWDANDAGELAEILTMQGRTWQLVRPGVLCTKSVGQAGPCNKRRGQPEPSRCQTRCDYRLEESWHREDVDNCIADAVRLYREESAKGEDLVASLWSGQVLTHIDRFPDLREKWMKDETVFAIVAGATA